MEIWSTVAGWQVEIALVLSGGFVALLENWGGAARREAGWWTACLGAVATTGLALWIWQGGFRAETAGGLFVLDAQAAFFKVLLAGSASWVMLLARGAGGAGQLLWATAACVAAAMAADVLAAAILLQIAAMVVGTAPGGWLRGDRRQRLNGALPGALLLVGALAVYLPGALQRMGTAAPDEYGWLVPLGWALVAAAVGGYLGIPPFQAWAVDLSADDWSKAAFAAVVLRGGVWAFMARWFDPGGGDGRLHLLWGLAAVAIVVGHLAAWGAPNLRRFALWLGVGQGGFVLVALLTPGRLGYEAFLCQGTLCGVGILGLSAAGRWVGDDANWERLAGLGRRQPLWGAVLALPILCLAGLPPTGGFGGRYLLWEALVAAGMWPALWGGLAAGLLAAAAACRLLARTLLHVGDGDGVVSHGVPETAVALVASLVCLLSSWWVGPLLQAVRRAGS